jgi:hypothetical protein
VNSSNSRQQPTILNPWNWDSLYKGHLKNVDHGDDRYSRAKNRLNSSRMDKVIFDHRTRTPVKLSSQIYKKGWKRPQRPVSSPLSRVAFSITMKFLYTISLPAVLAMFMAAGMPVAKKVRLLEKKENFMM